MSEDAPDSEHQREGDADREGVPFIEDINIDVRRPFPVNRPEQEWMCNPKRDSEEDGQVEGGLHL